MAETLNILFIGDLIGEPSIKIVEEKLKDLMHKHGIHFVIANGENLSGGKGILEKARTPSVSGGMPAREATAVYHVRSDQ